LSLISEIKYNQWLPILTKKRATIIILNISNKKIALQSKDRIKIILKIPQLEHDIFKLYWGKKHLRKSLLLNSRSIKEKNLNF